MRRCRHFFCQGSWDRESHGAVECRTPNVSQYETSIFCSTKNREVMQLFILQMNIDTWHAHGKFSCIHVFGSAESGCSNGLSHQEPRTLSCQLWVPTFGVCQRENERLLLRKRRGLEMIWNQHPQSLNFRNILFDHFQRPGGSPHFSTKKTATPPVDELSPGLAGWEHASLQGPEGNTRTQDFFGGHSTHWSVLFETTWFGPKINETGSNLGTSQQMISRGGGSQWASTYWALQVLKMFDYIHHSSVGR